MEEIKRLQSMVDPLVLWFEENGRMLPWRKDKKAYHIWISEIMLQQTKIEAVKNYYTRFMETLPTIQDLAQIEEEKLLKLWEGLGYYSRARNLKKAAIMIEQEYGGSMPNTYEKLLTLPGIGEYTAGAIASIAFNQKVPAVDGNVLRVVSRVIENSEDVLLPATKKKITAQLKLIMPEKAGVFNEAIMELGELICIPNGMPLCDQCPLKDLCLARAHNTTLTIPKREKKSKRKHEKITVMIIQYKDKVAIKKRKSTGLLANMYEFPNILGHLTVEEIKEWCCNNNLTVKNISEGKKHKHVFTHVEWDMTGYIVEVEGISNSFIWDTRDNILNNYPIPTAFLKFKKDI